MVVEPGRARATTTASRGASPWRRRSTSRLLDAGRRGGRLRALRGPLRRPRGRARLWLLALAAAGPRAAAPARSSGRRPRGCCGRRGGSRCRVLLTRPAPRRPCSPGTPLTAVLLGTGVWLLVRSAAGPEAGGPAYVGLAFLLSFAISMLAFVFPSGLGVREGAFALALAQNVPAAAWRWPLSVGTRLVHDPGRARVRRGRSCWWTGPPVSVAAPVPRCAAAARRRVGRAAPRAPQAAVWAMMALYAVLFAFLSLQRQRAFWTGRFDLGNMVQAVWSTAQGRPLETTDIAGRPVLAPRRARRPHPGAVHAARLDRRAARGASWWPRRSSWPPGALPAFWLGRRWLGDDRLAVAAAAVYLLYPPLQWATRHRVPPGHAGRAAAHVLHLGRRGAPLRAAVGARGAWPS